MVINVVFLLFFRYSININYLEAIWDAVFIGENFNVEPQVFDETNMGATTTTTGPDFCMEFNTDGDACFGSEGSCEFLTPGGIYTWTYAGGATALSIQVQAVI